MPRLVPKKKPNKVDGGFGTALTGGMAEQLIDNTLGVPEAVARAGQGAMNVGRGMLGMDMVRRQPGENILGLPSGRDVLSGAQALPGLLSGNFGEQFQGAQQQREQIAEGHPMGASIGGLLGDAATLATARAPMVRSQAAPRSGGIFDASIQQGIQKLLGATSGPKVGTKAAVNRMFKSEGVQHLARAAGRSLETGLEGAVMSIIQDGDPIETAALAAGGQGLSSLALTAAKESTEWPKYLGLRPKGPAGKVASVVVGAGVIGGLAQMLKSVTPGGRDRILESEEFGYDKIAMNMLLGATVGVLGKRAKADGVLAQFPAMADALMTVPRAGIIKMAQAAAEDPQLEQTVNTMVSNPAAFTESQWERFGSALESDDPAPKLRRILEEDEDFREKIDAPDPRLAGVPKTDEEDKE